MAFSRTLLAFLLLALSSFGEAADGFAEVILEVDDPGFVRVELGALPGFEGALLPELVCRDAAGEPVPLRVDEDGALYLFAPRATPFRLARYREDRDETMRSFLDTARQRTWRTAPGSVLAPLRTADLEVLAGDPVDHQMLLRVPPKGAAELAVDLPEGLLPEVVFLRVQGWRDAAARNRLSVEGQEEPFDWDGPDAATLQLTQVPPPVDGQLRLRLTNHNEPKNFNQVRRNMDSIWVHSVVVVRPAMTYRLEDARPPARVRQPLPSPIHAPTFGQEDSVGGDYVVITTPELAPALEPLLEWRRSRGLRPVVVDVRAIFDAFSGSVADAAAIPRFLQWVSDTWKTKPRYLLLAGDATLPHTDAPWSVPTHLVEVCGNGASASDVPHGFWDDAPQVAVGRLPARSVEELSVMVAKTIRYERDLVAGTWQRRVTLLMGEGRFGARQDTSIENLGTSIVAGYVPPELDVHVTFAKPGSPYVVPPDRFGEAVLERINEGSAFLAYVGHGSPDRLDDLRWGRKRVPILDMAQVPQVDCRAGLPVMFLIACSTGRYDDPRRQCLAEELLLRERGPVAVVAASRVSYPYANTILAKELINAFLRQDIRELGPGLDAARALFDEGADPLRAMIDLGAMSLLPDPLRMARERHDQKFLYNLLGDPALELALPAGEVDLAAPAEVWPGRELAISGTVTTRAGDPLAGGSAIITLEIERSRTFHELAETTGDLTDAANRERMAENYLRANDRVAARAEATLDAAGKFEVVLRAPARLPRGDYVVKVLALGDAAADSAAGAQTLERRRSAPEPEGF